MRATRSYPRAYIAACTAHGVITGKTPYLFAPYDPVTRAQIITMVARAAQLPAASPTYVPPFPTSARITILGQ